MSTPINHHYVSRCQSDKFFNNSEKKIFVLNKETGKIKAKTSTKSLFSEEHANSKVNNDLSVDSETLEKDLKDNYEDRYSTNVEIIERALKYPENPPKEFRAALNNLTEFGIIGEIRNPIYKKINDASISNMLFGQILPNAAPELKKQLEDLKESLSKTKYSNSIQYSDFAHEVFRSMGDIRIRLYQILTNKYFLLPDVSSIRARARINEYFNPDLTEIAIVGIPLSSKLFLHVQSSKVGLLTDSFLKLRTDSFPNEVEKINYGLYTGSYREVACEDYAYLEGFRDNLDTIEKYSTKK